MTAKKYRLGEMFSGPGGIALGAAEASRAHKRDGGSSSIHHGWAVDYHADTTATYAGNFGPGGSFEHFGPAACDSVITADVTEFDLSAVPSHNAFAFGFPCNDFSTVGEHKGLEGSYGALYTYGIHSLAIHAPDWFLAENVSGLSKANGGRALGKILAAMKRPRDTTRNDQSFAERYPGKLGQLDGNLEYELVAHLYRFEEYGVPQRRHRILIVGLRKDVAEKLRFPFRVPRPTTPARRQQKTVEDALDYDPISSGVPNNVPITHKGLVTERLRHIDPGKGAFNTDWTEHPELALNVKGVTLSNIYRRLAPDEPAYTVTGSGGGGTHMYHHRELRALTNRERARLQTFPDEFEFLGSQPSVRRQVGMAVPPEGAEMVLRAILKTLDGEDYAALDEPNIDVNDLISGYLQGEADLSHALSGEALDEIGIHGDRYKDSL